MFKRLYESSHFEGEIYLCSLFITSGYVTAFSRFIAYIREHTHKTAGTVRVTSGRRASMPKPIGKQEMGRGGGGGELPSQRFPIPYSAPHFLSHNFPPPSLTLHTHAHNPTTHKHTLTRSHVPTKLPTAVLMASR